MVRRSENKNAFIFIIVDVSVLKLLFYCIYNCFTCTCFDNVVRVRRVGSILVKQILVCVHSKIEFR